MDLLQDAVVLAQELKKASNGGNEGISRIPLQSLENALREYEKKRSLRVTKITVRSNLMGQILGEP